MSIAPDNRFITVETPFGPDVLAIIGYHGGETISEGFRFELDLFSEDPDLAFEEIVGKRITIIVSMRDDRTRYINGIVASFEHGHRTTEKEQGLGGHAFYHATIVPWSWMLGMWTNNRIFQEKTVKEIVDQVFADRGFIDREWKLGQTLNKRTYCVQYDETDLNFVSRLLEEEGIHYYFRHEKSRHVMVLSDASDKSDACEGHETARFHASRTELLDEDFIEQLTCARNITPTQYTLTDYNFESPNANLLVSTNTQKDQTHAVDGQREIYAYPGNYMEYNDGERYGKLRMEAEEVGITAIKGASLCRGFCAGYQFQLDGYGRSEMNGMNLLLVSVDHRARQGWEELGDAYDQEYRNTFTCIPADVPFRPPQRSRRPRIRGVQTAVVVGPSGEEINTDEHGRIKVQFHWDREGKRDDKSSCWIRVSQTWAAGSWGAVFIPRIGQEVIVEFIEGDPDRPIITGCVYNGNNKPPYGLPAEKTKSTIKSNSSKGGGGYNEFRFEDKKGEEEVYLQGEKDWNILIKNNKGQTIGNDETMSVGHDRTKTVGNNQSETIGVNKTISVGSNHSEAVGSNMSQTVGVNKAETIGAAKELTIGAAYQVSVGAAMNETVGAAKAEEIGAAKSVLVGKDSSESIGSNKSVDAAKDISESAGKNITINSGEKMSLTAGDDFSLAGKKKGVIDIKDQLTIKVGKATITLKKNGDITLSGAKINIKGSGNITIKGSKILEN
ncbi:type VI secretion system spike protein VgrG1b [Desulfosarcina cetonica]|uniref:type VI secretion system Vgr family protein n=1 Tax=Desulfosarcina cetonica TaxID=90730 RepID=UPI0006D16ED3|nr:type VI secretion system tip protein TssI/VgrG [Desulfosarcina cetonica]